MDEHELLCWFPECKTTAIYAFHGAPCWCIFGACPEHYTVKTQFICANQSVCRHMLSPKKPRTARKVTKPISVPAPAPTPPPQSLSAQAPAWSPDPTKPLIGTNGATYIKRA